jgi:hypothetical protein
MSPSKLWQRILAAPADPDLKTQYAAALIAAGDDPRAEVFSVDAEYERLLSNGDIKGARALESRLNALDAGCGAEFASLSVPWNGQIRVVRGWPCELTITAADFFNHAAEIVATLPIRHLNLTAISELPAVFEVTQLDQIASLDGSRQRWSDDAIGALANSRHVGALRWLNLSHCRITEAQIELLAASAGLRVVVMLDLSDNRARDPVDAAAGYGSDWQTGAIIPESIYVPRFGSQLESCHGRIPWLHTLQCYLDRYPPSRYSF